jgi:3-hydroxyisobutyrate dehydrogenase-like beta-hydroxyacid dehydrogenase
MGARVAWRLLDCGYEVHVWNRSRRRSAALVERGAQVAATPAAAAAAAEAVIVFVADRKALRAVSKGRDGLVAARTSATIIVMATVGPAAVLELARDLEPGTPLIDAPVSGSLAEVERGQLTIFVGGDEVPVTRWRPLLEVVGRPLLVGGVGAGSAAKLVANLALLEVVAALGESLSFAEALGLERSTIYDVLATTPLAGQAERRRPAIEVGTYPPRFKLALARKDAALIAEEAEAAGADLRLAMALRTWLVDADLAGRGGDDYTALLAQIAAARRPSSSIVER